MFLFKMRQIGLSLVELNLMETGWFNLRCIEKVHVCLRWDCTPTQIVNLVSIITEVCVELAKVMSCVLTGTNLTICRVYHCIIRTDVEVLGVRGEGRAPICYDEIISFEGIWLIEESFGVRCQSQDEMHPHLLGQRWQSSVLQEEVKTVNGQNTWPFAPS